jgi:hypothetical protein
LAFVYSIDVVILNHLTVDSAIVFIAVGIKMYDDRI